MIEYLGILFYHVFLCAYGAGGMPLAAVWGPLPPLSSTNVTDPVKMLFQNIIGKYPVVCLLRFHKFISLGPVTTTMSKLKIRKVGRVPTLGYWDNMIDGG